MENDNQTNVAGGPSSFRNLVGQLVEGNDLFPVMTTEAGEQMTVIDAIEKNETATYVPDDASDKMLDAIDCLKQIYDEMKDEQPDQDFIKRNIDQLKTYL